MKKKTNDLKKIVLNGEQVDALVFSLDVVIKKVGLRGLYTIVEIFQILQSPEEAGNQQEVEAKVFTYNVKEEPPLLPFPPAPIPAPPAPPPRYYRHLFHWMP